MSSGIHSRADSTPGQMALFDSGVDIARLQRAREVFMNAGKSPNTERAYATSWKAFNRWCFDAGRTAMPSTRETLELYLAHLLEQPLRIQTIRVRLCGIADRHLAAGYPSPFGEAARAMLSNAARVRKQRPNPKAALTVEHLRAVLALCSQTKGPKAQRDAALFLVGFALGWRRSELASLRISDVKFVSGKGMVVSLGASKTDQEGEGRVVSVPFGNHPDTCPVKRMEAWLAVRGRRPGALFCALTSTKLPANARSHLTGQGVYLLIKKLLQGIGADTRLYSPHSLRAGCVTAAYLNGANEKSIMARTGHRSVQTVLDYVRPLQGFQSDPLAGIL